MVSFSELDIALGAAAELERCAHFLDLEDRIVMRLRQHEQEATLNTSFLRDDGSVRPLSAIWLRHCSVPGPAVIPLTISREASLASEQARAMRTTWAAVLYGLEAGGGAAAIVLDPAEHSEPELRAAIHNIGEGMAEIAGDSLIVPHRLNPVEMEWLHAAFKHRNISAHIAGRMCSKRDDPTTSIAHGFLELIRCATGRVHGIRVAIQGFDENCRELIRQLHSKGANVIGVADESGGLRDPLGLDSAAILTFHRDHGMLLGFPETEAVMNADLLESDCDVLVLAANSNQVGQHNAGKIRASVILEIAPQAIVSSARATLCAAGKTIISDLLCDGISMLHFASETDRKNLAADSRAWMRRHVRRTWVEIQLAGLKWNLPLYQAAEMLAIQRVADAIRVRESEHRRYSGK